ncbi:MAG TPA: alpha-amylase family glycosyl hydrolase [Polyangia bacterium]|jgi:1,4-alpha-glucan branching enzyme|nr:alpha-amylase family glycosyl hydrolase [Polyangia bacterium]
MFARSAKDDGMGSLLYDGGTCRFRVWAPFAKSVKVEGVFTAWAAGAIDLNAEGNGNWSGEIDGVKALDLYKYLIENVGGPGNDDSVLLERADARALQVESSDAPSASYVIAPFNQTGRPAFTPPAFESFILYQLHVGSFSGLHDVPAAPAGRRTATFADVIPKLPYIKGLGFNAVALLPIGDVRDDLGGVGEGYGTCDMFAPEDEYGTNKSTAVADLLALVDAAHALGLAVIFDVVYGHSAIDNNRYWRYDGNAYGATAGGEYFDRGSYDTGFGAGFAFWQQEIKDFFLDNARMFLRDYRVDGLRFDAIQLVQPDAIQYVVGSLQREFPDRYLIAEYNPGDGHAWGPAMDPFLGLHFAATWDLAAPSQAFDALSGVSPVDRLLSLIGDFQNPAPWCSVRYLAGSHDQIFNDGSDIARRYLVERFGGRANGWALAKARLAWALTATLPGTPMLFMGTEGHLDGFWNPDLVAGVDRRVDWDRMGDPTGAPMQRLVRDINNLRWAHPALRAPAGNVTHQDPEGQVVAFKRYTLDGDLLLIVVNVSDNQWAFHDYGVSTAGESGAWVEIFNSQAPDYGGVDTTGNFAERLGVTDGKLFMNVPRWSVLVLRKD